MDRRHSDAPEAEPRKTTLAGRLSSATRQQQAVKLEKEERAAENPIKAFVVGAGRKLGGLVCVIWGREVLIGASVHAGVEKYVHLGLAVLLILLGLSALMPNVTFTLLRFLGLGGVVDKVLKRKAAA